MQSTQLKLGQNNMGKSFSIEQIWADLVNWVSSNLLVQSILVQTAAIAVLLVLCSVLARHLKRQLKQFIEGLHRDAWYHPLVATFKDMSFPIIGVILLGSYAGVAKIASWDSKLIESLIALFLAWIVISFASNLLGRGYMVKWVKTVVLMVAALQIFGVLEATTLLLDDLAFTLGQTRISLYTLGKGITILLFLLWFSAAISDAIEKRIHKERELTPSLRVLFSKLTRIFLFIFAVLIGLNAIGLDLTAFTVFGGAIGVGIGFGLQKVVSNLISGIILLSDRSIKPGDVIAVGQTYGWVNSLGARYVSVLTRDGKEHLIPNELLITEKVENWSFSNNEVRLRIPISVAYNTDVRLAIELVLEVSNECPRVLNDPEARCLLVGFGDSAVELELRVWIDDPVNGMGSVQSEILLGVWDAFKANQIEIPFPQRDIHIRTSSGNIEKKLTEKIKNKPD